MRALLFAAALMPLSSPQPQWVPLATSGGAMALVDRASIHRAHGIDEGDLAATTLNVIWPGANTPSGPMAWSLHDTYYNCFARNTTNQRTRMYDASGKLLGDEKGSGESRSADSDAIFGGTLRKLCAKAPVTGKAIMGTSAAVAFARPELARRNPGTLAIAANAPARPGDVDLSDLPDAASIELTNPPPRFYLYSLYRSREGRLVFYGQNKTGGNFTLEFRQPGRAEPLAVLDDKDYAGRKAKVAELGLTELKPYSRVWFEKGASFDMAPDHFWTQPCHHPYNAAFRINLPDGRYESWMIFKRWPKTARTIAYCDPHAPARVTYQYSDLYPEIHQFAPGRIYLKLPGEPVLVRFDANGKTSFPKGRDDIIFVPAARIKEAWKHVRDNGPAQQAAVNAADATIRRFGAMQKAAR